MACGAGGAGGGGRCLGPATAPTALTIVQSRSDTSMKRGRRARQAGVCPEPDMFTALTEGGRLPGSCWAAGSCAELIKRIQGCAKSAGNAPSLN